MIVLVALRDRLELRFGLKNRTLVMFYVLSALLDLTLLLDPSNCVFSVFPLDCFAVIDPETSRSLTNSVAASAFPSGLL